MALKELNKLLNEKVGGANPDLWNSMKREQTMALKLPIKFDLESSTLFRDADGEDIDVSVLSPDEVKRTGEYIATCVNEYSTLKEQLRLRDEMLAATNEQLERTISSLVGNQIQNNKHRMGALGSQDIDLVVERLESILEAYAAIKPVQQGD
jgi:hypothetical protein